jgi:hypothetical protein
MHIFLRARARSVPLGDFCRVVPGSLALIFRGQFSAVDCAHDLVLLHHSRVASSIILPDHSPVERLRYAFPDLLLRL